MTDKDKIVLCNYLICQDRFEESLQIHSSINEVEIRKEQELQYDYLTAYLDFMNGYPNFTKAKEICMNYLTYPILRWRNLFVEIANQLAEFEETQLIKNIIDEEKKKSNLEKSKTSTSLTCSLNGGNILVNYQNLKAVQINCYKIDLEAQFSLNPFKKPEASDYNLTLPFYSEKVELT